MVHVVALGQTCPQHLAATGRAASGEELVQRRQWLNGGEPVLLRRRAVLEPVAALIANLSLAESWQEQVRSAARDIHHQDAVQRFVAGQIVEVVILAEAETRRGRGRSEHHERASLKHLRELLPSCGELFGRVSHALGRRKRGGDQRPHDDEREADTNHRSVTHSHSSSCARCSTVSGWNAWSTSRSSRAMNPLRISRPLESVNCLSWSAAVTSSAPVRFAITRSALADAG